MTALIPSKAKCCLTRNEPLIQQDMFQCNLAILIITLRPQKYYKPRTILPRNRCPKNHFTENKSRIYRVYKKEWGGFNSENY